MRLDLYAPITEEVFTRNVLLSIFITKDVTHCNHRDSPVDEMGDFYLSNFRYLGVSMGVVRYFYLSSQTPLFYYFFFFLLFPSFICVLFIIISDISNPKVSKEGGCII